MPLAAGESLGQYRILDKLGEGGMGEVFRARDTELNRDVALKILPAAVAADPERVARFRREAQLLAALNHQNVAQVYNAADASGVSFLVMELVPGPTLAEVIDREGPLEPDVAVQIAAQIADGLEAAHEAGIIHRDLKPANVKRRDDDVVKILDFGLARALDSSAPESAATMSSPTMLSPAATQKGIILGTAGYMSPEQAKGRPADKRADIWAFGVVLYEMLTGKRLFSGDTVTELIASVIKDTPNLDAVPVTTPPALRHLLARCLERDPRLRLRDIGEARILLKGALDPAHPLNGAVQPGASVANAAAARPRSPLGVLSGLVAALALAGAAAWAAWSAKPETEVPVRRFALPAPVASASERVGPPRALSPDGTRIAYVHSGGLHIHDLRSGESTNLGAVPPSSGVPFWSPDSETVGYSAEATIRTIPAGGGATFTVCKIPASGQAIAAAWTGDSILIGVWRGSLYRVSAKGGTPVVDVPIDETTEIDFHSISPLPDGRLLLTVHSREGSGTLIVLSDGKTRRLLAKEAAVGDVQLAQPGYVMFTRQQTNQGLWMTPFDGQTLDLTRATLVEPGATAFDVADDGTVVAVMPRRERRELAWVTPSGSITAVPGSSFEPAAGGFALAPDGRRVAIVTRTNDFRIEAIVRDVANGTDTRLPMPGSQRTIADIGWASRDRLLVTAGSVEAMSIYDWPADGSSGGRPLVAGTGGSLIADGREMLLLTDERGEYRLSRSERQPDGSFGPSSLVFQGVEGPWTRAFSLSPDGRLLAYTVADRVTRQSNVWLVTYPDLKDRRQITSDGGGEPRFARDGSALYFLSNAQAGEGPARRRLQVLDVKTGPLTIGSPRTLLDESTPNYAGPPIGPFDVALDGRLLMTRVVPSAPGDEARALVLQNWPAAIRRK